MAGSRREKMGSILSRMTGLLRSGALKEEDRPIWYDIVKALPPKPVPPPKEIQSILYPEDFVKVHFYKTFHETGPTVLTNEKIKSVPQRFVDRYLKLQAQAEVPAVQLFDETIRVLKEEGVKLRTHEEKHEAERERRDSLSFRWQRPATVKEGHSKTLTEAVPDIKQHKSSQEIVDLDKLFKKK